MPVEDDNNLREINGARLQAEGNDIVSAPDGEEALALAVKEKPDLIISDVMMPRISGFDMLDILRNAPETKDTKVIMMTALSQAEDKARAEKLGADRYLVKSQVTLEDVANVVHEVLGDRPTDTPAETTQSETPEPIPAPSPDPTPEPSPPAPAADPTVAPRMPEVVSAAPTATPEPAPTVDAIANPVIEVEDVPAGSEVQSPPVFGATQTTQPVAAPPLDDNTAVTQQADDTTTLPPIVEPDQPDPAAIKVELPTPPQAAPTTPVDPGNDFVGPSLTEALAAEQQQATPTDQTPAIPNGAPTETIITPTQPVQQPQPEVPPTAPATPNVSGGKVIQPINDPTVQPDLNALLAAEEQNTPAANPDATTIIAPQNPSQPTPDPNQTKKNDDIDSIAL